MTQRDLVHVMLLGGFAVAVGGRRWGADLPTRRSAELVALLALSHQHRLVRDQVIEALWPHLDPDAGAANLRKAAHHARQALGRDDAVRLRGGRWRCSPARGRHRRRASSRPRRAALRSARARRLPTPSATRATCCPTRCTRSGPRPPRERLRARHVELLRRSGRWERLVELDPTDEAGPPGADA